MPRAKSLTELGPIEMRAPADLKPYLKNPRTHTEIQINQIVKSIEEFGFTNPLLIGNDDTIIAGHARLQAAQKLGLDQVPTIRLSSLTAAQRKAYVMADNQLALNAGWDTELLTGELGELLTDGFDISIIGLSELEAQQLFATDIDLDAQWAGMPAFEQDDQMSYRSITVHFENQGDLDSFGELVGQSLTMKTKSIWFPEQRRKRRLHIVGGQ